MQKAEALYDVVTSSSARGKFHSTRAMILRRLFESEKKEEYSERAFLEYTAAVICFEECGHQRHLARTENNLGFMLYKLNRFDEATIHLERARRVFYELKDTSLVAQV